MISQTIKLCTAVAAVTVKLKHIPPDALHQFFIGAAPRRLKSDPYCLQLHNPTNPPLITKRFHWWQTGPKTPVKPQPPHPSSSTDRPQNTAHHAPPYGGGERRESGEFGALVAILSGVDFTSGGEFVTCPPQTEAGAAASTAHRPSQDHRAAVPRPGTLE